MNGHHDNHREQEPVPPRLVEALAALHNERILVPTEVDDAILGAARAHLKKAARHERHRRRRVAWLAAAASVAFGAWLAHSLLAPHSPWLPPVVREDIDRNGHVDIQDALALARRIERGETLDHQWDINGDSVVDRKDVDRIAVKAVELGKGHG